MVLNDDFDIDISLPKKDPVIKHKVRELKRVKDIEDSVMCRDKPIVRVASEVTICNDGGLEVVDDFDEYEEEKTYLTDGVIIENNTFKNSGA